MKTKIFIGVLMLIVAGLIVIFYQTSDTKSAGWYLDRIVELRQEKQDLYDKISEIDSEIEAHRNIMDGLQYSGLNYLGLSQETQSPQRTGTQAPEMNGKKIEM